MSENLTNKPEFRTKTRNEILSDLIVCYDKLDDDQQNVLHLIENSVEKQKYLDDLNQLHRLDVINDISRRLKIIEYNLEADSLDDNIDTLVSKEQINLDTDVEILKYRQARKDIHDNKINLLQLRPEVISKLIVAPTGQQVLRQYVSARDCLQYMWKFSNINQQTLLDFAQEHGLNRAILYSHAKERTDHKIGGMYDNFRLTGLHYYDDLKLDLNSVSIFNIKHTASIMISAYNDYFKSQLEQTLIDALEHQAINQEQHKALRHYYQLSDCPIDYSSYQSHIDIDIDLMSEFDRQNKGL